MDAVIPITMREYNALHAAAAQLQSQLATLQTQLVDYPRLREHADRLTNQIVFQTRLLTNSYCLLRTGSDVLARQGRHAMDLSARLSRGEVLSEDAVQDAYLSAEHLLGEAEAFQVEAHEYNGLFVEDNGDGDDGSWRGGMGAGQGQTVLQGSRGEQSGQGVGRVWVLHGGGYQNTLQPGSQQYQHQHEHQHQHVQHHLGWSGYRRGYYQGT
jgi:hypothetical protein